MAERISELSKLITIATDMQLDSKLRTKAIEMIGNINTHDALLALLELVANEALMKRERELAIKYAREIIKST